jgi:hypothetical protein
MKINFISLIFFSFSIFLLLSSFFFFPQRFCMKKYTKEQQQQQRAREREFIFGYIKNFIFWRERLKRANSLLQKGKT